MVERYRIFSVLFFGSIWLLMLRGFIADEFFPPLKAAATPSLILTGGIFALLGLRCMSSRRDIIPALAYLLIAGVSSYVNHQSLFEFLNGSREFIGLLFTAPILRRVMTSRFRERFITSADKQLRIWLYIQAFCLLWQFARYGAGDEGGGSLGYGFSGVVSTLIYAVCFYLINKRWDASLSYLENLKANKEYLLLLLPTMTNETKISFFYMILFFIFLMKIDRRFVLRLILATPLAILLFCAAGAVYLFLTPSGSKFLKEEGFIVEYMVGHDLEELVSLSMAVQDQEIETDNLWVTDLPRFGKMLLVPEALSKADGGMWLGAGVGQFQNANAFHHTYFSRRYAWLLQGTIPMLFSLIIQLGILGIIWFLFDVASIYNYPSAFSRILNIRWYVWLVTILNLIYIDQFRLAIFCVVFFYIALAGFGMKADETPESLTAETSNPSEP